MSPVLAGHTIAVLALHERALAGRVRVMQSVQSLELSRESLATLAPVGADHWPRPTAQIVDSEDLWSRSNGLTMYWDRSRSV